MEQSEKLTAAVKDYLKALGGVEKATDFTELDKLRLDALAAFQQMERQLNRARPELMRLCRERRAEITLNRANERNALVTQAEPKVETPKDDKKETKTKKVKKETKTKKVKKETKTKKVKKETKTKKVKKETKTKKVKKAKK